MSGTDAFREAISTFGAAAKSKLSNVAATGAPEDQVRAPLERLIHDLAAITGLPSGAVDLVGESTLSSIASRPDYAFVVNNALVGFVEIKAPGKGADPRRFTDRHDKDQWNRLKSLPNLVYTDGNAFSLWRDGEIQGTIVRMDDDIETAGASLSAPPTLLPLVSDFLRWNPVPPRTPKQLAEVAARLCRLLRDEVIEQIQAGNSALTELAQDWRLLLFPQATDAEFADGYAQAVTFGLLVARAKDIPLIEGIDHAAQELRRTNSLIGTALRLLTDDTENQAALKMSIGTLMPGRTWVIAPDAQSLRKRWATLVRERDTARKDLLFHPHLRNGQPGDKHIRKRVETSLAGHPHRTPAVIDDDGEANAPIRYAFRSFDRQWIIPDARLINQPNPTLWNIYSGRQLYLTGLQRVSPTAGPAITFAGPIPDLDHYKGSFGGRVYPLWADAAATQPNIRPALLAQRFALVRDFADALAERHRCAVDFAIHAPNPAGDQRNHHAHLAWTEREVRGDGMGAKVRAFGGKSRAEELKRIRLAWERCCNRALARSGAAARVDARTLAAQGVARSPDRHVGAAGTAVARRGAGFHRTAIELAREVRIAREREAEAEALACWRRLIGHCRDGVRAGVAAGDALDLAKQFQAEERTSLRKGRRRRTLSARWRPSRALKGVVRTMVKLTCLCAGIAAPQRRPEPTLSAVLAAVAAVRTARESAMIRHRPAIRQL